MSSHDRKAAVPLVISRALAKTATSVKKAFTQPAPTVLPKTDLVDRSHCPALLTLTGLADDPDLGEYIRAQVRQLQDAFQAQGEAPSPSRPQACSCPSAGPGLWELAQAMRAGRPGWQDELAQSLLPRILAHLSASVVGNVHAALDAGRPLGWRDMLAASGQRPDRAGPASVVEAAGRAVQARLAPHARVLGACAVLGAFLGIVKAHWLACRSFRDGLGAEGPFPEHRYARHELVRAALDAYDRQPSPETFQVCADKLRVSLATLPCMLSSCTHRATL